MLHMVHQQRNATWRCFVRHVERSCRIGIIRSNVGVRTLQSMRILNCPKSALSSVSSSFSPVFFSTTSYNTGTLPPLKRAIRPFLLKCHPDMVQQEQSEIKQINLAAIQDLNHYVDTIQNALNDSITTVKTSAALHKQKNNSIKIEFYISQENAPSKKKKLKNAPDPSAETMMHYTRRGVEMAWPNAEESRSVIHAQALNQIYKLLHVAGLASESSSFNMLFRSNANDDDDDDAVEDAFLHDLGIGKDGKSIFHDKEGDAAAFDASPLGKRFAAGNKKKKSDRKPTADEIYERNRDRFTANINWKKYNELYEQALANRRADLATSGLYQNRGRRRRLVSQILSRVRVEEKDDDDDNDDQEEVGVIEKWIALRRLSLIFMDKFEELHLEELAGIWQNCHIVLTSPRPYHVSGSSMRRRKLRDGGDNGFAFTLHPDNSVTIQIPIDFRDDELVSELNQNIWDFYDVVGEGIDALFPKSWQAF